jgi:hypothetical protein
MTNRTPSNVKVTDRSVHIHGDSHGPIGTGDHINIGQSAVPPSPPPAPERAGTAGRVGIWVALIGAAAAIIAALIAHLK